MHSCIARVQGAQRAQREVLPQTDGGMGHDRKKAAGRELCRTYPCIVRVQGTQHAQGRYCLEPMAARGVTQSYPRGGAGGEKNARYEYHTGMVINST